MRADRVAEVRLRQLGQAAGKSSLAPPASRARRSSGILSFCPIRAVESVSIWDKGHCFRETKGGAVRDANFLRIFELLTSSKSRPVQLVFGTISVVTWSVSGKCPHAELDCPDAFGARMVGFDGGRAAIDVVGAVASAFQRSAFKLDIALENLGGPCPDRRWKAPRNCRAVKVSAVGEPCDQVCVTGRWRCGCHERPSSNDRRELLGRGVAVEDDEIARRYGAVAGDRQDEHVVRQSCSRPDCRTPDRASRHIARVASPSARRPTRSPGCSAPDAPQGAHERRHDLRLAGVLDEHVGAFEEYHGRQVVLRLDGAENRPQSPADRGHRRNMSHRKLPGAIRSRSRVSSFDTLPRSAKITKKSGRLPTCPR